MNERPTLLEANCSDCERFRRGRYEIDGVCFNCRTEYVLHIYRSHRAPMGSLSGFECPICGCQTVGVNQSAIGRAVVEESA